MNTMNNANETHNINGYSGAWQEALTPAPSVTIGDTVVTPEDPYGSGCNVDGREWSDFSSTLSRCSAQLDYTHTENGRDYYRVIAAANE